MYEIISSWLSSDMVNLLGSYAQPVAAALCVGLGVSGLVFCFALLSRLAGSLFNK